MGKKYEKKSKVIESEEKEFVEIRDGDVYMKLPKDFDYEQIIRILLTFRNKPSVSEPEPEPERVEIEEEPLIDENITRCPKCSSKLKSKVIKRGNELIRVVRCKKNKGFRKKCDFTHEFSIKV